jgi:integrase
MSPRRAKQSASDLPDAWQDVWETYEILRRGTLAPSTLANYLDSLIQFGRFLAAGGAEVPALGDVSRFHCKAFIDSVRERTTASTGAMRHRALAAVFGWLAAPGDGEEPYTESNPMRGLRLPRVEDDPVPVLDYDEVRHLLAACRGDRFEDRRDEAIVRFMFGTGCRRGEVGSMRLDGDWLDLRNGEARVVGKGRGGRPRERIVSLDDKTAAAIKRYLRVRSRHPSHAEPWLWLGRRGRLLGNGIYQALERRYDAAGLDPEKKAHIFRHTFSHYFRLDGGSEGDLMELNGWSSPAMAHRYGKSAAQARAREAHKRHSPGNKL